MLASRLAACYLWSIIHQNYSGSINFVLNPKITRSCQLLFSSVTEFIHRTIIKINLHIFDQWNQQENDIRMSDYWWFWFLSLSPIFNAFRLDQNFFSRPFFCSFLKNVKNVKSINNFTHVQGIPNLRVFTTPDPTIANFGLCTCKWGNFCISRGSPTVPLTQILSNAGFFKSQNPQTLCINEYW